MKLTKLVIKDYHQFKDLELDFTYPEGHPKAGQPLSKVCFIGQNGVGKTKILDLILKPYQYLTPSNIEYTVESKRTGRFTFDVKTELQSFWNEFNFENNPSKIIYFPLTGNLVGFNPQLGNQTDWNFTDQKVIIADQQIVNQLAQRISFLETADSNNFKYDSQENKNPDIKSYQRVENLFSNIENLLSGSNLKYKGFSRNTKILVLENQSGDEIKVDDLSSGTKQIIYQILPLQEINPNDSIILIDEPETSLHPELQKKIVDIYTKTGTDNQFFFATHSPIIAGQFEKDEIFILYFDEDGVVRVRKPQENINYLDLEATVEILYPEINPTNSNTQSGDLKLFEVKKTVSMLKKLEAESGKDTFEFENLWSKYLKQADEISLYTTYPEYQYYAPNK